MKTTVATWLLGGALAASLSWNWRWMSLECAPAPGAAVQACAVGGCDLGAGSVGLAPAQEAELEELCARSCGESDRLERRAAELQRELLASLAAESVDRVEADRLVREIAELRRRSLAACVEGVLGVRELLDADQVRAMLGCCEPGSCR